MAEATGLFKELRIKAQPTFATAPGASGSRLLRRTSCTLDSKRQSYRSNEILPDRQIRDYRHGTELQQGTLAGELSPGTYSDIFASLLAGTFASGATTGAVTTIASAIAVVNTSPGTFTRSSGSYFTNGFKVGDIVRCSGWATGGSTANNARNYRITALSATVMSVGPTPTTAFPSTGDEAVVTQAAGDTVTIVVTGKKLVIPQSSLLDPMFAIESYFSNITRSELFLDCKASSGAVQLPPTGLGTVSFPITGRSCDIAGTEYFTSPTALSTAGITAAVNGILRLNGADLAIVTGLNFNINGGHTTEAVVGSNLTPGIYPGMIDINGQFTALYQDGSITTLFKDETEVSLQVYLTLTSAINTDFISFFFPRIKLGSADKDDPPGAIKQTCSFQALNNTSGGAGTSSDFTTMSIQDSLAA